MLQVVCWKRFTEYLSLANPYLSTSYDIAVFAGILAVCRTVAKKKW